MRIIYMDVDQCRSARKQIFDLKNDLESYTNQVINSGEAIVGYSWRAQGANYYLSELNEWKASMRKLLNKLDTMEGKLKREIEEWIRVAKDF